MASISSEKLQKLAETTQPVCVSLYVPTDPIHSDPRTNSIAFKNLIQTTLERLESLKLDGPLKKN